LRAIIVILCLLAPAIGLCAELVDRMVAIVDDDPILLSDLEIAVAEEIYLMRMRGEEIPEDSALIDSLRRDVLERMIDRKVVVAKAKEMGIEISRTEVEDALDRWIKDMTEAAGSEEAFAAELQRQGLTLKELKLRYRKDIEEQLLVNRFMKQQFSDIEVSEGDVVHFYETKYDSIPELPAAVGLSHIIIVPRVDAEREQEAIRRIEHAHERITAGEPFETVAKDVSDDPLTRNNGGLIGTVMLDDLRKEIADIARQLKPGEVSKPVRTRYGFEIVKVDTVENDRYTLRHIFVRLEMTHDDTARALKLAEDIRSRALAGESFESLARQYSDDEQSRLNGGYLGEIDISALDQVYRDAIDEMEPGDISDVIHTDQGFQILKLVSKGSRRKPSLDEARQWIRNFIEARRREQMFKEWLDEARQEVYVKYFEL